MKYYLAPMEGITGYIFRNVYDKYYPGIDKFYTPFIVPANKRGFRTRELNDILPEHNKGKRVVPQILTNNSDDFNKLASSLKEMGYDEVNLNLGCPSGTVVSRGKGAGFLSKCEELDRFLYNIYESADISISIKTRIGIYEADEFYQLLDIYNKYNIFELTIHPRVLKEYYSGEVHLEVIRYAVNNSRNPLCYNGDISDSESFERIADMFPEVNKVMIGRGLIGNPQLIDMITNKTAVDYGKLKEFHDVLMEEYMRTMSGELSALCKMKEIWFYMIKLFPGNEKNLKKIRKLQHFKEYYPVVSDIFSSVND